MITRTAIVSALRAALESHKQIDAAWEGGSVSFGRQDEFSDIDVICVVADDAIDLVFDDIHRALDILSPVSLSLDMPPFPGHRQRFYRLRDAGEFLVVDVELIRRSDPVLFREVELHGHGHDWFDRTGVLVERHVDSHADMALARARSKTLSVQFEMFQHLVLKEISRGLAVDALDNYQTWTLRPLVEALRLLHAPHTRIFGMRYLDRDLPAPVVALIQELAFVGSLVQLRELHGQAVQWGRCCFRRLDMEGPGAGLSALDFGTPNRI